MASASNQKKELPPIPEKPPRPPKKWTSLPTEAEIAETKRRQRIYKITSNLIDGTEDYTVREMFEKYRHNWPQILVVKEGCIGESNFDQFSTGDAFRIHKHFQFPCAVARDTNGRILSIPMDVSVNFKVVKGPDKYGPEQTLSEIVAKHQLPVTVRFAVPNSHVLQFRNEEHPAGSFGCMALLDVYHETYLLSNTLHTSGFSADVVIIPMYVEMLMATVSACKVLTDKEWKEYLDELTVLANKVNFDTVEGRKVMTICDEMPPEIDTHDDYDYIFPDEYVSIVMRSQSTQDSWKQHLSGIYVDKIYDEICPEIPKRERINPPSATSSKTNLKKQEKREGIHRSRGQGSDSSHPEAEDKKSRGSDSSHAEAQDKKSHGIHTFTDHCSAIGGFVADTLKRKTKSLEHPSKSSSVDSSSLGEEQTCFEDSPLDIESLGIEELCEYLEQLRLHKYVKVFRKKGISGTILKSLTEPILKKELHFKDYEAIKLMAFVNKGHIPR